MKLTVLTDDQKKTFLADPTKCPFCGDADLDPQPYVEDDSGIVRDPLSARVWIACGSCHRSFNVTCRPAEVSDDVEHCENCERPIDPNEEALWCSGIGQFACEACGIVPLNEHGLAIWRHDENPSRTAERSYRWVDRLLVIDAQDGRRTVVEDVKFSTFDFSGWVSMKVEEYQQQVAASG